MLARPITRSGPAGSRTPVLACRYPESTRVSGLRPASCCFTACTATYSPAILFRSSPGLTLLATARPRRGAGRTSCRWPLLVGDEIYERVSHLSARIVTSVHSNRSRIRPDREPAGVGRCCQLLSAAAGRTAEAQPAWHSFNPTSSQSPCRARCMLRRTQLQQ